MRHICEYDLNKSSLLLPQTCLIISHQTPLDEGILVNYYASKLGITAFQEAFQALQIERFQTNLQYRNQNAPSVQQWLPYNFRIATMYLVIVSPIFFSESASVTGDKHASIFEIGQYNVIRQTIHVNVLILSHLLRCQGIG